MSDADGKKPITRGDVKTVWAIIAAVVIVVGAYFKLENSYSRLESKFDDITRRTTIIETKQNAQDTILRGIEKSVSRIEGRLGVTAPAGNGDGR